MNLKYNHILFIKRTITLLLTIFPIYLGYSLFFKIIEFRNITIYEYYQLIILFFLFLILSYGSTISIIGFIIINLKRLFPNLNHKENININNPNLRNIPLAIIMPIFEEEIAPTFNRILFMFKSIEKKFPNNKIDFFILSDTRNPEHWLNEEIAFYNLCNEIQIYDRIFYRRRKINLNKKSGNVSDFCRRWGQLYKYMIILDADSLMTSECIFTMLGEMELNPNLGILQSPPRIAFGNTLYQKMIQFNTSLFNPILLAGSNFWQDCSASYWGHNAIIRMVPFIEHCALPRLPDYGALGGRILSHDTIEAALMKKAGYEVRMLHNLSGSYEGSPPNLLETFKRDNRWCQGNFQHLWFLFVKIPLVNKMHIIFGILAYFNSMLWGIFICLSIYTFWDDYRYFSLSMLPKEFKHFTDFVYFPIHLELIYLTLILLFLPRILSYLNLIISSILTKFKRKLLFITISLFLETLFSILVAPIFLFFYSIFIIYTLLNKKIEWDPQNRNINNSKILKLSFRSFSGLTLLGITSAIFLYDQLPISFYSTLPIWIGWIFSIPISYFSSLSVSSNSFLSSLFLIDEGTQSNNEILDFQKLEERLQVSEFKVKSLNEKSGIFSVLVDPMYFSLHLSLQGKKKAQLALSTKQKNLIYKLLKYGPGNLSKQDLTIILSNRNVLTYLHNKIWRTKIIKLGDFWKFHWAEYQ